MAIHCPYCQATAYTRASETQGSLSRRNYYQCSNMQCGVSFRTTEEIDGVLDAAYKPYTTIDSLLIAAPGGS